MLENTSKFSAARAKSGSKSGALQQRAVQKVELSCNSDEAQLKYNETQYTDERKSRAEATYVLLLTKTLFLTSS